MPGGLLFNRRHGGFAAAVLSLCWSHVLADSPTTELRIAIGLLRSQAAELERLHTEGRRARLHASGAAFTMSLGTAKALAAAESLDAAAVAALDDAGREALHALVARGHYHLDKPRRR